MIVANSICIWTIIYSRNLYFSVLFLIRHSLNASQTILTDAFSSPRAPAWLPSEKHAAPAHSHRR